MPKAKKPAFQWPKLYDLDDLAGLDLRKSEEQSDSDESGFSARPVNDFTAPKTVEGDENIQPGPIAAYQGPKMAPFSALLKLETPIVNLSGRDMSGYNGALDNESPKNQVEFDIPQRENGLIRPTDPGAQEPFPAWKWSKFAWWYYAQDDKHLRKTLFDLD